MDNSFALDLVEHDSIYVKTIEPASFLGTKPVANPKIIIIGGQPGAGKSKLVEMAMNEFADRLKFKGLR